MGYTREGTSFTEYLLNVCDFTGIKYTYLIWPNKKTLKMIPNWTMFSKTTGSPEQCRPSLQCTPQSLWESGESCIHTHTNGQGWKPQLMDECTEVQDMKGLHLSSVIHTRIHIHRSRTSMLYVQKWIEIGYDPGINSSYSDSLIIFFLLYNFQFLCNRHTLRLYRGKQKWKLWRSN